GWVAAIGVVLIGSAWLGFFAYRHVDYEGELWWQFAWAGDAPRFMRASVGAVTLLVVAVLARLLTPVRGPSRTASSDELERAAAIVEAATESSAHLALVADKSLLFSESGNAFIMYDISGSSWVSMGEPVGPQDEKRELIWRFRELSESHGGKPVFYQIGTKDLTAYIDLGLVMAKLGEEARVPLAEFELAQHKGLKRTCRQLEERGFLFRVLMPEGVASRIEDLRAVSNAWLAHVEGEEKGFSLGFFEAHYLGRGSVAGLERESTILAFANIWEGAGRIEASVDLMRFMPAVAPGLMDCLLTRLILHFKEAGYAWFSLGMAPLSGMHDGPIAPLWSRLGALAFRHGERLYHFQGLRKYKEKFGPHWSPCYLASPGGMALPGVIVDLVRLISRHRQVGQAAGSSSLETPRGADGG
ncbi:MAG: bifunctional lysylphosphatidylglycerol flippase/synthetase MprF, partial [Planctomycetes bacterium]|nr:bifunctional lysylphosphatidylglycerol flippase/synthetase MprF [Planctomycetota bacterium]